MITVFRNVWNASSKYCEVKLNFATEQTLNPARHTVPCRQAGLALFERSEFRQFPRGGAVLGGAKRIKSITPINTGNFSL